MSFKKLAFLLILLLVIVSACKQNAKKTSTATDIAKPVNTNSVEALEKEKNNIPYSKRPEYKRFLDSMSLIGYDTSTIKMKAKALVNTYNIENCQYLLCSTKDTLLDFNYDGNKDLALYYFTHAGSGLKNIANIYLFNKALNKFSDTVFTSLNNPSFYLEHKQYTVFYIAHGGGSGGLFGWYSGSWKKLTSYSFSKGDRKGWKVEIFNELKKEGGRLYQKDFSPVPENRILRNKYN